MPLFPFFVDISQQKGLLVGGGQKALQKALKLREYAENLQIIAPEPLSELVELAADQGWQLTQREFREEDLGTAPVYVVAAVEDTLAGRQIGAACRVRKIPVNVVDDPDYCDFVFPSLVSAGKLSIGITTDGASPVTAALLREQIEQLIPENTEQILDWLEEKKNWMRQCCPQAKERREYMRQVTVEAFARNRVLTEEELLHIFRCEEKG